MLVATQIGVPSALGILATTLPAPSDLAEDQEEHKEARTVRNLALPTGVRKLAFPGKTARAACAPPQRGLPRRPRRGARLFPGRRIYPRPRRLEESQADGPALAKVPRGVPRGAPDGDGAEHDGLRKQGTRPDESTRARARVTRRARVLLTISSIVMSPEPLKSYSWWIMSTFSRIVSLESIAIAPMIIVIMAAGGMTGLMPKGVISMYLSYFPIVVGMTKGLRSSEPILEDQMKTWSATAFQTFWLLRLPSAMPFLFPAMKIGLAAALVGAVVAELPSGARAGLGARLLVFSYRSETIPMWANLVSAALLAGILVVSFGLLERAVNRRLGFRNAGDVTS